MLRWIVDRCQEVVVWSDGLLDFADRCQLLVFCDSLLDLVARIRVRNYCACVRVCLLLCA